MGGSQQWTIQRNGIGVCKMRTVNNENADTISFELYPDTESDYAKLKKICEHSHITIGNFRHELSSLNRRGINALRVTVFHELTCDPSRVVLVHLKPHAQADKERKIKILEDKGLL